MIDHRLRRTFAQSLGALLLIAAPALAADAERRVERTFAGTPDRILELENLAGNVELVAATGSEIRLVGTIHASGESPAAAGRLADQLQVTFDESAGRILVKAVYPLDEYRKYHYPRRGDDPGDDSWFAAWFDGSSSSFKYAGREVRVVSSPGGGAATLYADFRLELPAGVGATVRDGIGRITSDGIAGPQLLDIASGEITATHGAGKLDIDTGSGDVAVSDHRGDVGVDTGSGDVRLERVEAQLVAVDTGSGDVTFAKVSGSLRADTGSGNIAGSDLVLGSSLAADTGSGDVLLAGDLSAVEKLLIDTGSGDVTLDTRGGLDARLAISTGSGDIRIDLPELQVELDRDDFHGKLGSGRGQASIETGSGDVVLRGR